MTSFQAIQGIYARDAYTEIENALARVPLGGTVHHYPHTVAWSEDGPLYCSEVTGGLISTQIIRGYGATRVESVIDACTKAKDAKKKEAE